MDHAVKVQREITKPTPLRRSRGKAIAATLLCVPLLVFCGYSWVARPELIWGPGPESAPPVQREAGLRVAMFLLAQRIEGVRAKEGSYPASLEADDSIEGVSYTPISDRTFELRATHDGKAIVLRSDASIEEFLGSSTTAIQERGR